MKLYMKKILLIVVTFFTLVAIQIAADEIEVARHLWSLVGLITLISWIVKLLKKILVNFFKDLDEFSMKWKETI